MGDAAITRGQTNVLKRKRSSSQQQDALAETRAGPGRKKPKGGATVKKTAGLSENTAEECVRGGQTELGGRRGQSALGAEGGGEANLADDTMPACPAAAPALPPPGRGRRAATCHFCGKNKKTEFVNCSKCRKAKYCLGCLENW